MELVRSLSNKIFSKGIFIVTGSGLIRAGQPYKVAVFGHDFKKGEQITLILKSSDGNNETVKVSPHDNENQIVSFNIRDDAKLTYTLVAKYDSFEEIRNLHKNNKRVSAFIQTDKSTYKPSDTVQFRVIIVDSNTKPVDTPNVQMIYITDGADNRVKQYDNPIFYRGVLQTSFKLSDLPVFGSWKIHTSINDVVTSKAFEVAEYVLPKFKVSIDGSSDIHYKFERIRLTIKAKYTYGKDVKGKAVMTIQVATAYHQFETYGRPDKTVTKTINVDGKAVVELDLPKDLDLNDNKYNRIVMIEVKLKEELTGKEAKATHNVRVHNTLYSFDLIKSREKFKSKLPFDVKAIVRNRDRNTPVTDSFEPVKFSLTYYYFEKSRYRSSDSPPSEKNDTKTFNILPENGVAKLDLDLDKKYTRFHVKAKYMDSEKTLLSILKAETECNEYIMARLLTERPVLSKNVSIEILSTEKISKVSYQIYARGECVDSKTLTFESTKRHVFEFQPTFKMMPKAKIVFSHVTSESEILSDQFEIEFDNELINYIDVSLPSRQVKPGSMMEISVSTQANSFVGLLGVDQSVLLLKSGNDLTTSMVFQELAKYGNIEEFNKSNQANYRDFFDGGAIIITNAKKPYVRKPIQSTFSSRRRRDDDDDDREEFYLSSARMDRSEMRFRSAALPRARREKKLSFDDSDEELDTVFYKKSAKEKSSPKPETAFEVRREFPETWLFENLEFNMDETTKTISRPVPDSITSWVISAFSICPETGLAITKNPSKFSVFQPFFVSTNLPYSIKRGEVVSIPIILFNYMDKEQIADVTLFNDENEFEFIDMDFDKINRETKRSKTTAIKASDGTTVSFSIRPLKVGNITIKVVAQTMLAGDGVERQLKVEPEGITHFVNDALLLDLRNSSELKRNFDISVPNSYITDSIFVEVSAIGDVLGPTIDNLDKLIKIPYGCGEQNMLNFVPNILVLEYLTTVRKLTDSVQAKTKSYMEQGYQRELTYMHDTGAYSAFGKSDRKGSTWLTAFVAKSFEQAAKYIKIDQKIITKAFEFLSTTQEANGSFPEKGYVIYKWMQGESSSGLALTAYTLVAFLENVNRREKFKNTIDRAINFIVANMNELNDLYSLAVTTYAMQLAKHELKDTLLQKLDAAAIRECGFMYWKKDLASGKNPSAINTEITAYALLAYIEAGRQIEGIPIMKWLITQRNSNGGFQSTQDTIVGLTALAKIAGSIHDSNSELEILVKPKSSPAFSININQSNVMVLQKFDLSSNDKSVEVTARGKGVGIFQFSYRYNLSEGEKYQRFNLEPVIETTSNKNFLHLTIGANFIPDEETEKSNMVVMEVTLPSGFTFDTDHLKTLLTSPRVKRVETKNDESVVIVYFDDLDKSILRPEIKAVRTHKVAKQKPAPILIYDYYDNSRRATKFYSTPEISVADIF